jgi:hypothetical protein
VILQVFQKEGPHECGDRLFRKKINLWVLDHFPCRWRTCHTWSQAKYSKYLACNEVAGHGVRARRCGDSECASYS